MTIDRAVMAFAGLVILASLGLAQLLQSDVAPADGLRRTESDPGLVHRLLSGRDDFQTIGDQGGNGVPIGSETTRVQWQRRRQGASA